MLMKTTRRLFRLTAKEIAAYAERDRLIALLGMAPEDRSSADARYCATTGEMWSWAVKDGLVQV